MLFFLLCCNFTSFQASAACLYVCLLILEPLTPSLFHFPIQFQLVFHLSDSGLRSRLQLPIGPDTLKRATRRWTTHAVNLPTASRLITLPAGHVSGASSTPRRPPRTALPTLGHALAPSLLGKTCARTEARRKEERHKNSKTWIPKYFLKLQRIRARFKP